MGGSNAIVCHARFLASARRGWYAPRMQIQTAEVSAPPTFWADELAERVLSGIAVTRAEAMRLLTAGDEEIPRLLAAAFRIRQHHYGLRVKVCQLRNARSGLCPEDCHYCSQSAIS